MTRFIARERLSPWLEAMARERTVLAPRKHGAVTAFEPFTPGFDLDTSLESVTPPKDIIYPQTEVLFRYRQVLDPDNPGTRDVDIRPDDSVEPAVVFGSRPCGVKGFLAFDPVFMNGDISDPRYAARRESVLFVTLACSLPGSSCFCHWTGGDPGDGKGSDVLLTPVADGFTAEAQTKNGEDLLGLLDFPEADAAAIGEAKEILAKSRERLGEPVDLSRAPEALENLFEDLSFWEDVTAGCVGCGACTYLCPTCWCFNITDESDGVDGVRLRTWDSCMFHHYTQEASGHNPRPDKAHRMRNRIGHKYWYHPLSHNGDIACCGCGRCVRHCPGAVDVRDILIKALERLHD